MSTLSILDPSHDMDYLMSKLKEAGVDNHVGWDEFEDGNYHLRYRSEDFDAVQAVLDAYEVTYAEDVVRPGLRAEVTALRKVRQAQPVNFNGLMLETDLNTISLITAAAYLMDADPTSAQSRLWKVNDEVWIDLDRNTLVAMGRAIADNTQAMFEQEKALLDSIAAATTLAELEAIDVAAGWPA